MRREWFLALASVLILLVLLEGATRLYYLVRGGVPPTPDESLRNEWAWAAAHLREGRAVVPGGSDYDAQLGWRPNENIDAWVRRKGWGLADGELTVPRRPRVEFVGDSFTYGLYVSDDESFAVRLGADHLRDHEIVNFGVNGYGADQMLLLYETIGRLYRPDIVVMGLYVGGFDRAQLRFTYYAKPWFDIGARGALRLHDQPVMAPEVLYGEYASGARRIAPWPSSYLWNTVAASLRRIGSARRITSTQDGAAGTVCSRCAGRRCRARSVDHPVAARGLRRVGRRGRRPTRARRRMSFRDLAGAACGGVSCGRCARSGSKTVPRAQRRRALYRCGPRAGSGGAREGADRAARVPRSIARYVRPFAAAANGRLEVRANDDPDGPRPAPR
jgi:hypothetical protein